MWDVFANFFLFLFLFFLFLFFFFSFFFLFFLFFGGVGGKPAQQKAAEKKDIVVDPFDDTDVRIVMGQVIFPFCFESFP